MNQSAPAHLLRLVICSTQGPYAARGLEDATYPAIVEAPLVHKNPAHQCTI